MVESNRNQFINEMEYRNDKLYVVLRGHLYIENELNKLIDGYLPYAKTLELNKMSFYNKTKLALSLNLLDELTSNALLNLNTIRNNYAHNLKYNVSKKEITDLRISISKIPGFEIYNEEFEVDGKNNNVINLKACIVGLRSLLYQKAKCIVREFPTFDLTKLEN